MNDKGRTGEMENPAGGMRRVISSISVGLLAIGAVLCGGSSYIAREVLVFLALAALVAFFGMSVFLLSLLLRKVTLFTIRFVTKVKQTTISVPNTNPACQSNPLEAASVISDAENAASS